MTLSVLPEFKRCKVCLYEKLKINFDRDPKMMDGLSETCQLCCVINRRPVPLKPRTRVFKEDGLWQHYCPKTREFMRYWFWESAIHSANNCTKMCSKALGRKDKET